MTALVDTIRRIMTPPQDSQWPIITATVVGTITALRFAHIALDHRTEQTVPSARATLLPRISKEEAAALDYPPDALPGGRYVDSPYGVIRVYEWGPEDGRKVLFVHGITTPCIALGALAQGLVNKGCRVMLFVSAPFPTHRAHLASDLFHGWMQSMSSLPSQSIDSAIHGCAIWELLRIQSRVKLCTQDLARGT